MCNSETSYTSLSQKCKGIHHEGLLKSSGERSHYSSMLSIIKDVDNNIKINIKFKMLCVFSVY